MRNFSTVIPVIICVFMIVNIMSGCASPESSQEEKNMTIARLWFEEVWNKKNLSLMDEICTSDFQIHGSSRSGNVEERKKSLQVYFTAFPDQQFIIENIFASKDMVIIRWSWSGTNIGEFLGNPPTDVHVSSMGINTFRFVNGKIAEQWSGWDILNFMQQLGYNIVPPGEQAKVKEEENKTIAHHYIEELWNKKNLDEIDKLVSDDFVNHSSPPGMPPDREGLRQFIAGSGATFPDGHYTIEDMIAEEDKVMIRGSFKGTHRGEFMRIPGTGKEITMTWINVLRMKDGKVAERWMKYDEIDMMSQFGFSLVPPGKKPQSPFIGTWKLQSFEQRNADDPNSPPVYPYGRDLYGLIMYNEDGHMAVTLMKEHRPAFSSGDLTGGTTDEKTSAFDAYITYCGTYEVQEKEIIHHIEASLFPNWTGNDQKRLFEFEGDMMTLSTPPFPLGGINQTVRLVWNRIK